MAKVGRKSGGKESKVVQWLVLLPQGKKALGLELLDDWGVLYVHIIHAPS